MALRSGRSGGVNCLGDLGTHVENIVADVTGLKIRRVLAKMDVIVPGRVLDDNDSVLVEYTNGASGIYWTSQVAIGADNSLRLRVYGSKGTILWFQETPEKITVIDNDGTIREIHRGYGAVTPKAAQYGRLPAGHGEGWLEAWATCTAALPSACGPRRTGPLPPTSLTIPPSPTAPTAWPLWRPAWRATARAMSGFPFNAEHTRT